MPFQHLTLIPSRRFFSVDIWAYRVKALLLETGPEGLKVLGMGHARQNRSAMIDGEISDLRAVAKCIDLALTRASESVGIARPQDAIVSLQTHSLATDTFAMNYRRTSPTSGISMSEIDEMVARTETTALDRMSRRLEGELAILPTEARLVSTLLTSVVIDSKKVYNPIGFTGSEARYRVLNAFVPRSDLSAIRNVFTTLGIRLISCIPPALALTKLVEGSEAAFEPFIVVDVGECQTLVSVSVDGELKGSSVIPFGARMFDQRLRRQQPQLSYFDIEAFLQDPKTLSASSMIEYRAVMRFIAESVVTTVTNIDRSIRPSRVYVCGGVLSSEESLQVFSHALEWVYSLSKWAVQRSLLPESECESALTPSWAVAYSLGVVAHEMFAVLSWHPLSDMLRSIVYRYE